MTYQEDDDIQSTGLNAALWRPMLAHARPYWRSFMGLGLAGMAVALCDVLLPRVTGVVIDPRAIYPDVDRANNRWPR